MGRFLSPAGVPRLQPLSVPHTRSHAANVISFHGSQHHICEDICTVVWKQEGMSAPSGYLQPPKEVRDVLLSPLPPVASLSPSREHLLLATPVRYVPVADLAEPFLRLGGTRVVPRNRSLHGETYYSAYSLLRIADATIQTIEPAALVS
jgi:hypothetical protein